MVEFDRAANPNRIVPAQMGDKNKQSPFNNVKDMTSRENIDRLKEKIKKEGFNGYLEISLNDKGAIALTEGNHRLQALKELGYESVPVKVLGRNTVKGDYFEMVEGGKKRQYGLNLNKDFKDQSLYPEQKQEVKPTEVKAEEVKVEVVKPKVEIKAEPKTLSVENKEYTTKTGRQKVVLKNNDLKVIDIKTGKEASPATRRKALDEYVERYDFSKGKTAQENTKEAPQELSSEEADRFTIEQSENPLEVASAYIYEEPISKFSGSKDAMIAEFGVGKITQESFERWKDENLIT
jgi:hypothetical protein